MVEATMYELEGQLLQLQQWAEEAEDDDEKQAIADTLEMVEQDFTDKAGGYFRVIRNLEAKTAGIKAQEDILKDEMKRLATYRGQVEKNIERIKDRMLHALTVTGKKNIKTDVGTIGSRTTQSVVITAENIYDLPDECLRYKDPEPDKTAIKDYLKEHPDCEWAHMESKTALSLR